jgi:hypothetical protein
MKKFLLIASGFISLALGVIGILLPVLPTTPFVLLAAICFSASHKGLNGWLTKSRLFGPFIENYRTGKGIGKRHKIVSVLFLWTGLTVSMLITKIVWLCFILFFVGAGVSYHIITGFPFRNFRVNKTDSQ